MAPILWQWSVFNIASKSEMERIILLVCNLNHEYNLWFEFVLVVPPRLFLEFVRPAARFM